MAEQKRLYEPALPARPSEERVVIVSEVSVSKGGTEPGGGRRPYEPPRVLGLSPVDEGRGLTNCQAGSGNSSGCQAGTAPLNDCTAGNMIVR